MDFSAHAVYATAHNYVVEPTAKKPVTELDALPLQTPGHPCAAQIQPAEPYLERPKNNLSATSKTPAVPPPFLASASAHGKFASWRTNLAYRRQFVKR